MRLSGSTLSTGLTLLDLAFLCFLSQIKVSHPSSAALIPLHIVSSLTPPFFLCPFQNKVLKLTGEVQALKIQAAQGASNADKIAVEQKKLTSASPFFLPSTCLSSLLLELTPSLVFFLAR